MSFARHVQPPNVDFYRRDRATTLSPTASLLGARPTSFAQETTPELDAQLCALLNQPMTPLAAADRMKVSVGWVYWRLREWGWTHSE